MPLYRYVCETCGHEKVVMHGMNESPEIICENCNSTMKKTIGRIGVIFKGSGFYITDSRNNGNGKSSSKDSSSENKKGCSSCSEKAETTKSKN